MRHATSALALLFAATALVPVAFGDSMSGKDEAIKTGAAQPPAFDTIDSNDDHAISKDEAKRTAVIKDGDFAQIDKDGDGQLSKGEYQDAVSRDMLSRHASAAE